MQSSLKHNYIEFNDNCLIQSIKAAMPEQELAERYTGIIFKRKGRRWWARCPLHGERTPSLMLNEKGKLRCFGCGWYGDVLDFIGAVRGMTLAEVIRMLTSDLGLSRDSPPYERRVIRQKIHQEKQERQAVSQFEEAINVAFISLSAIGRAAQSVINTIESDLDFERAEIVIAFDTICIIDWLCGELASQEPERQYTALKRAKNGGLIC